MTAVRRLVPHPSPPALRACLLSNGRYTVMTRDMGSGFSQWRNLAITRWREDATADMLGCYVLIRDLRSGITWSPTRQPLGTSDDIGSLALGDGCAEYAATRDGVDATLTIGVAEDRDCEMRRLTLRNTGTVDREVDVTSYAELVLGSATADAAHPAFSKLFVETQWQSQRGVLIAHRRLRSPDEASVWAAHGVVAADETGVHVDYETDRGRFLGRGRDLSNAQALVQSLTRTTGAVLDPIFSSRVRVSLAAGASTTVTFWTLAAPSRAELLGVCDAVSSVTGCERIIASAGNYEAALCAQIGIGDAERALLQRCVAPLFVADAHWRAPAATLLRGSGGAPALWPHGVSGDRPIVLMRVSDDNDAITLLLRAQRFWQAMGVGVDVVLSNGADESAAEALQSALGARIAEHRTHVERQDAPRADVFVVDERNVTEAFRDAVATAARIVCDASTGGLAGLDAAGTHAIDVTGDAQPTQASSLTASVAPATRRSAPRSTTRAPLAFDNGIGGFDVGGREYVIRLDRDHCTPAPWINVLANPSFGCFVSAEGGGYTWSINSQQNPLTPWPNDAITDAAHDVVYIRDDDTSDVWTTTANPLRARDAVYEIRHGKGYTVFASTANGIEVESTLCVPLHDSVKLTRLTLRNRSNRARSLTLTAFVDWALGGNGTVASPYIATSSDAKTGALFARNAWRAEFGERVAFIDFGGAQQSVSGNRATFLGRGGTLAAPAALRHGAPLDGATGIGLDPCGALRMHVTLAAGDECDLRLALGDAASVDAAQALVMTYRAIDFGTVLQDVRAAWNDMLDTISVRTPDTALDVLVNDWLVYQTLACRVWARTAYYQASGAYGFRDQLQDVMALCIARPDVAREHLLRAASRQFVEGDVQHWWLPPAGQGLRTRMTDDRLWLPYVLARYLRVTGDDVVLDECIPFITGPVLADGQQDAFFTPSETGAATLYEHCARAIDVSLANGVHGLPLIGTGDWNDGMNRVGIGGRGESVWLAWFVVATIDAMAPIANARGDSERAARWRAHATALRQALDDTGWDGPDGEWYRRGYYDDGTPLGSRDSSECRIDAIAQSWSVMANGSNRARCERALDAVDRELIRDDARIALLFTPPFDETTHDPGYIKGYPPGIRENGGQYTHGSIWSIFAFAGLGKGNRAHALFALINPISHALNGADVERYRVEPYVACADVYSVAPHVGRGGWTWYTGSAGWLYRAALEAILGFDLQGNTLLIDPCVPADWPGYEIDYVRQGDAGRKTRFTIVVDNTAGVERGVASVSIDGGPPQAMHGKPARIALTDDIATHRIRVTLG